MKSQTTFKAALAACLFGAALGASATTTIFSTTLGAAGEPVPTSFATGAAIVSFDDVADTVTVQLSFQGLANNAPFGHIHCCTVTPASGNAPVALNFTPLPAVTTGIYSNVFALTPTAFDSLLAGAMAGTAYVNIHTPGTYAGGEIRGFLPAVPEPGSYAMLLAGLAALAGVTRQRRQR